MCFFFWGGGAFLLYKPQSEYSVFWGEIEVRKSEMQNFV